LAEENYMSNMLTNRNILNNGNSNNFSQSFLQKGDE